MTEAMADILPESQFVEKIAQKHRNVFQKLLDRLKAFIQEIKDHFTFIGATSSSEVAAVTEQINGAVRYAEKIVEAFDRVAVEAVERYQEGAQTQKNTAESGVKYKQRDRNIASYMQPITNQDILILRGIGRKSINQFTSHDLKKSEKWAYKFYKELGVKSPFFRSWFGDWRAKSTEPAEIVEFTTGENGKINYEKRTVKNRDMNGRRIAVDDTVIDDSVHYAKQHGDEKQIKKLLGKIDEILEKGILLDTQISEKSSGNKKGSTQFMHYLYTPVSINGAPFIAKSSVEEYDLASQTRAYNLRRITLSALSRAQFADIISQNRGKYAYSADALSVSQLFDFVKQNDKNFQPNPLSCVVNEDGTPKIMYHGTNAEWNVYDLSRNSNQMWGEGIYLAETAERARLYGDNVKALYVKALHNNREAKKLGVERDHVRMSNGDILVFSPDQIKSATDNIGTFDGSNPDIRYQHRTTTLSNRSLLANAFEGVAQNDIERRKLQEYRDKINRMEAEERKLSELNEKIKVLSFAEGPRDAKTLSALRDEARKTANRLNIYDKQLLSLAASKPLQAVLDREKNKVRKVEDQKKQEALADYRKSRERTEVRRKIYRVTDELNRLYRQERTEKQ